MSSKSKKHNTPSHSDRKRQRVEFVGSRTAAVSSSRSSTIVQNATSTSENESESEKLSDENQDEAEERCDENEFEQKPDKGDPPEPLENDQLWLVEPREPLIFRDGRPFGAAPGAHAHSLSFPFPSTTTGALRSKIGFTRGIFAKSDDDDAAARKEQKEAVDKLKQINVRGPLLAQLDENGAVKTWLLPAPLDALLLTSEKKKENPQGTGQQTPGTSNTVPDNDYKNIKQGEDEQEIEKKDAGEKGADKPLQVNQLIPLDPQKWIAEVESDLQSAKKGESLWLVGLPEPRSEKPSSSPRYWNWDKYIQWLIDPAKICATLRTKDELGLDGPQLEQRTHVAIDPKTRTGIDGALFTTSSLEFMQYNEPASTSDEEKAKRSLLTVPNLKHIQSLALAILLEKDENAAEIEGYGTLGGERRIVNWRQSQGNKTIKGLLEPPQCLIDDIKADKRCRLILLTPAFFYSKNDPNGAADGYYPTWILQEREGIKPELGAILNRPPQVISGWDLIERKPKKTHRLTPAGSVLYLELKNKAGKEARDEDIENWIRAIWLHNISDWTEDDKDRVADGKQPQYQRDGFGLAILGRWEKEMSGTTDTGKQTSNAPKGEE